MEIGNDCAALGQEAAQGMELRKCAADCSATESARAKKLDPRTKRAAMVRAFLEVGPEGLNCFQAALRYGDFVLRTTCSELTRYHGVTFTKKFEQVPGRNGSRVDCVRYALTDEGAARARELLEGDHAN